MSKRRCLPVSLLLVLNTACAGSASSPTPTESSPWIEEEVAFPFGPNELYGILTLPPSERPHPAIGLIYGSADVSTGTRAGVSSRYFSEHARQMARHGFAVLRYDPPGVGRSTGESGFESLDLRAEEAMAALRYLQSRPDIRPDQVGLFGVSQGAWVIAMAAAAFPEDVGFLISVSGAGVSVAQQQVHSIQAQSQAAGMSEQDITKAVLVGRLLIDWQLAEPLYRQVNQADAQALGEGPWTCFAAMVYEPGDVTPAEGLQQGIDLLASIQDEPWAEFLYLKELYLPQLRSIPPEQVEALKATVGQTLLNDPEEYWTRVRCPVLAVFGENDLLQPTEESAALYERYLARAGNEDVTIVIVPGVGHSINLSTAGYGDALSAWLDQRAAE